MNDIVRNIWSGPATAMAAELKADV